MNYANFCAVLGHIEKHPEEWDQKHWCGSACCIAGHAAAMNRALHPTDDSNDIIRGAEAFLGLPKNGWFNDESSLADWLFKSTRTLDDFRRLRLVAGYANFPKAA